MDAVRHIVNADDFGFSPGVNRGILEAHRHGIVTETSLLANGPAFDEAARLARETPSLAVGVHVNLTEFAPVGELKNVSGLAGADGRFQGMKKFCRDMVAGTIGAESIRAEIFAQIQKALDAGIHPSHLNTHQHAHVFRPVFQGLLAAAEHFHVRAIRITSESYPPVRRWFSKEPLKRLLFGLNASDYKTELDRAGVRYAEHFWGLDKAVETRPLEEWARVLEALESGSHELMCHPGVAEHNPGDAYRERRARELAALQDPLLSRLIRRRNIDLITSRDL